MYSYVYNQLRWVSVLATQNPTNTSINSTCCGNATYRMTFSRSKERFQGPCRKEGLHSSSFRTTSFTIPYAPRCLSQGCSVQFSSVAQSCATLCDPKNRSTPGLPVHHQHPESTQSHVHRVGDAIQPSYPLSSHSPPALNLSQHQGLFK